MNIHTHRHTNIIKFNKIIFETHFFSYMYVIIMFCTQMLCYRSVCISYVLYIQKNVKVSCILYIFVYYNKNLFI